MTLYLPEGATVFRIDCSQHCCFGPQGGNGGLAARSGLRPGRMTLYLPGGSKIVPRTVNSLHQFLSMTPPAEAQSRWEAHFGAVSETENVNLDGALDRVLAADIAAPHDLPGFPRSTVDGYAVRARDTFGASEGIPSMLNMAGEIQIGSASGITLPPGGAAWVPTGGMLPEGADAVIMLEYTEVLGDLIQITRPVAPGDNVIGPSEDVSESAVILTAGRRLGPGEIGLLAALGVTRIPVAAPIRVAVLSSGDEIVPVGQSPGPGQVRDVNRHTIGALVRKAGALVVHCSLVRDDEDLLVAAISEALAQAHFVVLSGGSSVGNRDYTITAINRCGRPGVLVHGVAIRPGKPTVLAVVGGVPVLGLPGHPVSAMVAWRLFGEPALAALAGSEPRPRWVRPAVLDVNLASASGREDFYRVRLLERNGTVFAAPILGKSGLISTMAGADGMVRIPAGREGLQAGEIVEVEPL